MKINATFSFGLLRMKNLELPTIKSTSFIVADRYTAEEEIGGERDAGDEQSYSNDDSEDETMEDVPGDNDYDVEEDMESEEGASEFQARLVPA